MKIDGEENFKFQFFSPPGQTSSLQVVCSVRGMKLFAEAHSAPSFSASAIFGLWWKEYHKYATKRGLKFESILKEPCSSFDREDMIQNWGEYWIDILMHLVLPLVETWDMRIEKEVKNWTLSFLWCHRHKWQSRRSTSPKSQLHSQLKMKAS